MTEEKVSFKKKNYETLNHELADNYVLSVKSHSATQVKVRLETGKTYTYLCTFVVAPGDVVIVGNGLNGFQRCEYTPKATTGAFGVVTEVEAKATVKPHYASYIDFVFKKNAEKETISACATYLRAEQITRHLTMGKNLDCAYLTTFFARKMLAAASILANPAYASKNAINAATEYIRAPQDISDFYNNCPGLDIVLSDIHSPFESKPLDAMLKKIRNCKILESGFCYVDGKNHRKIDREAMNEYLTAATKIASCSIMLRGGFQNLFAAFLTAGPTLAEIKLELLELASKFGAAEGAKLLNQNTEEFHEQPACAKKTVEKKPVYYSVDGTTFMVHKNGTNVSGKNIPFESMLSFSEENMGKETKLVVEDGIKTIGTGVFSEMSFGKVILPSTLQTIANDAFSYIETQELIVPNGVQKVGKSFLAESEVGVVILPPSVSKLQDQAFADATIRIMIICADTDCWDMDYSGHHPEYHFDHAYKYTGVGVYEALVAAAKESEEALLKKCQELCEETMW